MELDIRSKSNEDDPAPSALQVILHADQAERRPSRSEYMRSGLPRPPRPIEAITNNYLPPRGLEPPRVEVLAPRAEEVKDILRRLESFHRGASAAGQLGNLYPHMYRLSVIVRGLGLHEDYTMTLLAAIPNEDIPQIIDDGIQVRNRDFAQSTELVRKGVSSCVVSLLFVFLIANGFLCWLLLLFGTWRCSIMSLSSG